MAYPWLVLVPPVLVFVTSLWWQNVTQALVLGIIAACLIAGNGTIGMTWQVFMDAVNNSILDHQTLYIALFLFILGIIINIIDYVGGAKKFSQLLAGHIHSRISAQWASIGMSLSLFVDDNLNTVTTGYIMHPLTDRFAIPRVKLAYLVDSLSAPVTIMIPISSWVAMIIRQFDFSGISTDLTEKPFIVADPFYAYLVSIPFILYSLMTLVSIMYIVMSNSSFGPMAEQETIAATTGNLFGGKAEVRAENHSSHNEQSSARNLLAPISTLVLAVLLGILWSGNCWLLGGTASLIQTFQQANTFLVLLIAAIASLIVTITTAFFPTKLIQRQQLLPLIFHGLRIMQPAVIIIMLAGMFGVLLKEHLHTGAYLAQITITLVPIVWFPLLLFIISSAISITTGTSWGTIAVMLPIAIEMLAHAQLTTIPASIDQLCILLPTIGAVLSGAIAGDHISPVSATTIMASTSAGAYHIDHVITQAWYAVPALLSSAVGFAIAGHLSVCTTPFTTLAVSLSISAILCCMLLSLATWLYRLSR